MQRAWVFVCSLACVFVAVFGQAPSLCRANERFLFCGGCQKTCKDPAPECAGLCQVGCFCEEGQVRNETGHCVQLADCPPLRSVATFKESAELRNYCPADEEYSFCEPCPKTCDNPDPICPAQCSRGCFCRAGLVRDRDGRCVKLEKCSGNETHELSTVTSIPNHLKVCGLHQVFKECQPCEKTCANPNPMCPAQCTSGCFCEDQYYKTENGDCVTLEKCPKDLNIPIVYHLTCGPDQVFRECEPCEKTCSNPEPQCPAQCSRGCFCKDGLVKTPHGSCVLLENCPRAQLTFARELSFEECSSNEEFLSCGWCEPSCHMPTPECPQACTTGCLCRPPLLRHKTGQCVEAAACNNTKCTDPNEEYVCRYTCEARCDGRKCIRTRTCTLRCHCKFGWLRNVDGKCVTKEDCF